MRYTGKENTQCPTCKSQDMRHPHPVLFRKNNEYQFGQTICRTCFMSLYGRSLILHNEKDIPEFQEFLDVTTRKLVGLPEEYSIKGYWFGFFDDNSLGLIVNYSNE